MATFTGSIFNDTITPTYVSPFVLKSIFTPKPGNGDDYIYGNGGNDWLDGGYGFDHIDGGSGIDSVTYTFYSGNVNANLSTGVVSFPGNSTKTEKLVSIENLYMGSGNDTVTGSAYDNYISTGAGNDYVYAGYGDDTIYGGSGNDWLDGGYGYDEINGGTGTDTTSYTFYSGRVNANLATGVVSFPTGGSGTDKLTSIENIYTGSNHDMVTGSTADNVISTGAGNDTIYGGDGDDSLYGGSDDDWIDGGYGFDYINGGSGTDTTSYTFYSGDVDADLETGVVAFPGNSTDTDTLYSIERIYTGMGDDTVRGNDDDNMIHTGSGDDKLIGGYGEDTLYGSHGKDKLYGGNDDDRLYGGDDKDKLYGGKDDDYLHGGDANDKLKGQKGDDTLDGGEGRDKYWGGKGADTFVFKYADDSRPGDADKVYGFDGAGHAHGDVFDLSSIDADTDTAGFQHLEFSHGPGNGKVWMENDGKNTVLLGNTDGDKGIEFKVVIKDGHIEAHDYSAHDFIL
ncbi:calcium-binding protein [Amaricoccus tamworthensis]|uniref:calcium-binding protein n=1 Tax=Amaricoccus tamworthensis TaxID=57002 RepID=UPI003C7A4EED